MKQIGAAFAENLLDSERRVADLMVARLVYGGAIIRCINHDEALYLDVADGDGTQRFDPLSFRRAEVTRGGTLQVDSLTIEVPNVELLVTYGADSETTSLGDMVLNGVFDLAEVWLYQVNLENNGIFTHSRWDVVGAPSITPTVVAIQMQSAFGRAVRPCPQTVIQPGCNNALYDTWCGVVRAGYTVSGSATGGTRTHLTSAVAGATGYYALGEIEFTGGLNVGARRTIGKHTDDGSLFWAQPLRFEVKAGDTFTLAAGCDKTWATCDARFSNTAKYRGFPNVPSSETF